MEYRNSYARIDGITDIETISKQICKKYNFGDYVDYQLIDVGYEDFNYILRTKDNKYVVKIFNTDRDESSCRRLVDILVKSMNHGIPVPEVYQVGGEYIFEAKVDNTSLKMFVMEFIDGENYWELDRELNDDELQQVAEIAAKINLIDYGIREPFYDEWTVTNLKIEYAKKMHCLNSADKAMISQIIDDFEAINFDSMKHAYIHGDIIKANLILDKTGKIYVIDFSAFNYLPRIIEISASLLGLCLTNDRKSTVQKINTFLNSYNKQNKLENDEVVNLPLILEALASMYIIQTCYIKSTSGDYLENDYWLAEGRKFLAMSITNTDIRVGD